MRFLKGLAAVIADRWQIPLALVALVVVGLTLLSLKPRREPVPFDALLSDILTLVEAGHYYDAADATANLIEQKPPLPRHQRAVLHDLLAEIIYRQEQLRVVPNAANLRLLLDESEQAKACGLRPSARAALRTARAHEWLGQSDEAVADYRLVLQRQPEPDDRRAALQGLVRLLAGVPTAQEERRRYIQALLDEEGVSPAYLWWALQYAIKDALDDDDIERAKNLLEDHGSRLQRSDLKGYYDYMWAWVHLKEGRPDLAAPLVERVEQWLEQHARADAEMDRAGFLPAMNRLLRGRIELAEARPQAALHYFEEALGLQSHGELLVEATLGRIEALACLERHEAARRTVRETLGRLESDPPTLAAAQPRLRNELEELARRCIAQRRTDDALAYLALQLELTPASMSAARLDLLERIGNENEEAAKRAHDPARRRKLHLAAARAYERAAELATMDEPRLASLQWSSATEYDLAGEIVDAQRMLEKFVDGRSLDPRMPQALLRLGQALAAGGNFEQAIEKYQRLIDDYPRLSEAQQARLAKATCLIAMGQERYAEAEQILRDLLEDQYVTPGAQVYRDALSQLCDLLYTRQAYAEAIGRMEDFLVFYPQDPERYRISFMLADAYRASAYRLRDDAQLGPEAARLKVSQERFRRAASLFGRYVNEMGRRQDKTADQVVYERLALFYRGDCLFELGDEQALDEALAVYRQAAARYQGEPAALVAQVQIANIYLRQGKVTEAARAVERARWLLGSIPDRMFAEYGGMDRKQWDEYLSAVRSSELFRDVLADPVSLSASGSDKYP